MRRKWCCLGPIALALFLATLSCGDDDTTGPLIEDPTGLPAATTIDILLDNFQAAYTSMNYDEYERLLDEGFRFVFDPDDINEEQPKPWYSRGDELDSTRNMFSQQPDTRNRIAQSISMAFVAGDPEVSPENEDWRKIVLSSFELELEAIQTDNGETWFLRTKGGYLVDLHVVQTEEVDLGTQARIWKIVRIVDRPPTTMKNRLATEEATWGQIRSSYR